MKKCILDEVGDITYTQTYTPVKWGSHLAYFVVLSTYCMRFNVCFPAKLTAVSWHPS